jgi:hypothetical protein
VEKGLEITFKVSDIDERQITEALANIVGNEFLERIELDWRIFHVKLEDERFFKVCYTGPKMSRLHPLLEKEVRMRFETLSLSSKDEILKLYREEEKKKAFRRQYTREVEEERDLWQDNFWAYF